MAFKLNVDHPFKAQSAPQNMTDLLFETRQGLRSQPRGGAMKRPATQAALAVAVFVLGFSAATLRPALLGRADAYDMTPTGSIAKKDVGPALKARSCE